MIFNRPSEINSLCWEPPNNDTCLVRESNRQPAACQVDVLTTTLPRISYSNRSCNRDPGGLFQHSQDKRQSSRVCEWNGNCARIKKVVVSICRDVMKASRINLALPPLSLLLIVLSFTATKLPWKVHRSLVWSHAMHPSIMAHVQSAADRIQIHCYKSEFK